MSNEFRVYVGNRYYTTDGITTIQSILFDNFRKQLCLYENNKQVGTLSIQDYLGIPTHPVSSNTVTELIEKHKCSGVLLFDGGYITLSEVTEDAATYYKYNGRDVLKYKDTKFEVRSVGYDKVLIGVIKDTELDLYLDIYYSNEDKKMKVCNLFMDPLYVLKGIVDYEDFDYPILRDMLTMVAEAFKGRGVIWSQGKFIILDRDDLGVASYFRFEQMDKEYSVCRYTLEEVK